MATGPQERELNELAEWIVTHQDFDKLGYREDDIGAILATATMPITALPGQRGRELDRRASAVQHLREIAQQLRRGAFARAAMREPLSRTEAANREAINASYRAHAATAVALGSMRDLQRHLREADPAFRDRLDDMMQALSRVESLSQEIVAKYPATERVEVTMFIDGDDRFRTSL